MGDLYYRHAIPIIYLSLTKPTISPACVSWPAKVRRVRVRVRRRTDFHHRRATALVLESNTGLVTVSCLVSPAFGPVQGACFWKEVEYILSLAQARRKDGRARTGAKRRQCTLPLPLGEDLVAMKGDVTWAWRFSFITDSTQIVRNLSLKYFVFIDKIQYFFYSLHRPFHYVSQNIHRKASKTFKAYKIDLEVHAVWSLQYPYSGTLKWKWLMFSKILTTYWMTNE